MAAVDLPAPAVAHFDLTIPGRCPVADNKMVGEPVLHPSHVTMVIIECRGIALSRPAIVHDDVLPPPLHDRGAVNLGPDGARKITITPAAATSSRSKKTGKEAAWLFITGLFDRNLRRLFFYRRDGRQRSGHCHGSRQWGGWGLNWRGGWAFLRGSGGFWPLLWLRCCLCFLFRGPLLSCRRSFFRGRFLLRRLRFRGRTWRFFRFGRRGYFRRLARFR